MLGAVDPLAPESPGGEDDLPQAPLLDRAMRHLHGLGVAVVEVDREEQPALLGRAEERIGLVEVEDQRLLHQQWETGADDLQRRGEVFPVGQGEADQVGLLLVQHLIDVEVASQVELPGAGLSLLRRPPGHRAEVHILPMGEHPRVLEAPTAGPDDGDLDFLVAHCSTTTFPAAPSANVSNARAISSIPKRCVMICPR